MTLHSNGVRLVSSRRLILPALALLGAALLVALADAAAAQEAASTVGGQNLRPYRFLFVAYALAWILVMGWVVSVGRRLSRLDRRLRD